ncbi:MAG TPA: heavy metal translocating P-type ATPase [Pseudogracilibacillus sp.]|nr:heavy metal translocating P-type ATPase [Pseudogracilibacillus sp.]
MENKTFHIEGMTCAACSTRVEKVLNKMDDVNAKVNLATESATIAYEDDVSPIDIVNKIKKTGYDVVTDKLELTILGMTCAACSSRVDKVLNKQDGIIKASVNLTTETATIEYYPDIITEKDIMQKIEKTGYEPVRKEKAEANDRKEEELTKMKWLLGISAILSLPLLITMLDHLLGIELPALFMNPWFQFILATPVQFIVGYRFYKGAYNVLKSKSVNMDVLVVLGTSAAYFYSLYEGILTIGNPSYEPHLYFETSAILITLILFGKFLEARAKGKTTEAIAKLVEMQAKEARVIREGKELLISIEDVVVGDILVVKPGEKIPVDGIVRRGSTAIDESTLTGESIPVEKETESDVYSATMNINGTIEMEATNVGEDTVFASIIRAVENAQGEKAPIQRMADVISGVFVPIVIGVAILTFAIWIIFVNPGDFEAALRPAIAVLVIACPCALGLATPTSIMVGTGKGAENGILYKGGEHLERTHEVDTVVFDKTGTITNGTPEVTDFIANEEIIALVASAEKDSEHPLATAIVDYAEEKQIKLHNVENFEAVAGGGIRALVDGRHVLVGTRKLMRDNGIEIKAYEEQVEQLELAGKTAMFIAVDDQYEGIVAVADTIKDTAIETMKLLQEKNIDVIMLTGDNERTAQVIAKEVGISEVISEVLPEDKADKVEALQASGKKVAMVGDGINDAPALAMADIGIAMGTGAEVAIEAADITILGEDLRLVARAIRLSDATIRNVKQNLFWAFGYNTIGIPIAALGLLAPWIAGAAMALSSVSVVLNSLRLKRVNI